MEKVGQSGLGGRVLFTACADWGAVSGIWPPFRPLVVHLPTSSVRIPCPVDQLLAVAWQSLTADRPLSLAWVDAS